MKLRFNEKERELLANLQIPFDIDSDLAIEQFCSLWDIVSEKCGFGTEQSDAYEEILVTMYEQDK